LRRAVGTNDGHRSGCANLTLEGILTKADDPAHRQKAIYSLGLTCGKISWPSCVPSISAARRSPARCGHG
jgi:hypothetical protein